MSYYKGKKKSSLKAFNEDFPYYMIGLECDNCHQHLALKIPLFKYRKLIKVKK